MDMRDKVFKNIWIYTEIFRSSAFGESQIKATAGT
jgi:hypothetical protein